jgi:quinol-cytochrome oxidoreductase complex cytochrome b subunit
VGQVRTWVWRATVAFGFVLLVTGVWLSFVYRPTPLGTDEQQLLRVVHRVTASLFPGLALVLAVLHGVERRRSLPWGGGVFLLALALSFTGYLLPWDQLALYAVTVGTNMRGMFDATFNDQVKFVIVGGAEIDKSTLRNWFVVHAAVLPVLLTVCLAALRRRSSTVARTGV